MHKPSQQFVSLMHDIRDASLDERSHFLEGYFPYETIKFSGRLKFLDVSKKVGIFTRRHRVRFLEDGVSVLFDRVWGDGVLLTSYLTPGAAVMEPIRTSNGYVLPLRLPRPFRKGETFELVSHRRITGGFEDVQGYWDTSMSKPTETIQITVIKPKGSAIERPEIVAPPRGDFDLVLRENSVQLRVSRPALNSRYRLRWSWKDESRAARPTL